MLRYAISDRCLFQGDEAERQSLVVRQAARLARQGVDFFQVREKDLSPETLLALTQNLRDAVRATGAAMRVILNAPPELAASAGVGWHANGVTTSPGPAVSVSCHSLADIVAWRARASLLLFAPVFEKNVRRERVAAGSGLQALRQAVDAAAGTPVIALGGITEANAPDCVAAGAAGIAGIRLFFADERAPSS